MLAFDLLKKGESFGETVAVAKVEPEHDPQLIASGANVPETRGGAGGAGGKLPVASLMSLTQVDPRVAKAKKVEEGTGAALVRPDGRPVTRVLLCGTHPENSNGYSRVTCNTARYLGLCPDFKLTIYGFQNYQQCPTDGRKDIPDSVVIHDALAHENPRRNGFGEKEIGDFLKKNPQDIVIIFNDSMVTTALTQTIVNELSPEERKRFKLVAYVDQTSQKQKREYIKILNDHYDAIIAFTPYWEGVIRSLGLRESIPTYFYPHGCNPAKNFPVPRKLARIFLGLSPDAFIALQLNRNQPRKRLDHTMMVWADIVSRHIALKKERSTKNPPRMIQLLIGTQMNGYWNLSDIYEHELNLRGIDIEEGKKYIISVAKPQQMSDRDINIMYNACDIGLNTCEGEGFGLCQFEHAAVGGPQVAPNIGGFREFLNAGNSITVEAKWRYYIDSQRDGIGGIAEVGDPTDYADAVWKYYMNPNLVAKHGAQARREILQHYRWETMVDHLIGVLGKIRDL